MGSLSHWAKNFNPTLGILWKNETDDATSQVVDLPTQPWMNDLDILLSKHSLSPLFL